MPIITLAGRTDVEDYFERSGVFNAEDVTDTPFLVFIAQDDAVKVEIVDSPAKLLAYPDDTPVMTQWVTDETSAYFHFSVAQFKQQRAAHFQRLRLARHVVKMIGPRGGFRSLTYDYTNASGVTIHVATGIRDEAERLETFFRKNNIPVAIQTIH
jgi:hypothetical protein